MKELQQQLEIDNTSLSPSESYSRCVSIQFILDELNGVEGRLEHLLRSLTRFYVKSVFNVDDFMKAQATTIMSRFHEDGPRGNAEAVWPSTLLSLPGVDIGAFVCIHLRQLYHCQQFRRIVDYTKLVRGTSNDIETTNFALSAMDGVRQPEPMIHNMILDDEDTKTAVEFFLRMRRHVDADKYSCLFGGDGANDLVEHHIVGGYGATTTDLTTRHHTASPESHGYGGELMQSSAWNGVADLSDIGVQRHIVSRWNSLRLWVSAAVELCPSLLWLRPLLRFREFLDLLHQHFSAFGLPPEE